MNTNHKLKNHLSKFDHSTIGLNIEELLSDEVVADERNDDERLGQFNPAVDGVVLTAVT